MKILRIDQFISELCLIPEQQFTNGVVHDFLQRNSVEKASLEPYLFFTDKFYTRNLIFKNHLFEVMTLCWEAGQKSRIHNHSEQNCWMTVPFGKLLIQNFNEVESNYAENFSRIEPSTTINLGDDLPAAEVDLEEPIHQVCNSRQFNERATSIHIYSKPFDRCLVYTPEKNHVQEVRLFYTSINGRICEGIKL